MQRQRVVLSHLRWISAALVALSHCRALFMQDFHGGPATAKIFYFITGFGHSSVVVFFVLSGFLVGGKVRAMAAEGQPDLWRYMVDRFSRIFLVAWPAIILSLAVLAAVAALSPAAPYLTSPRWSSALATPLAGDFRPFRWIATSVLLNELVAATPATNGPLWSLSCEWTYYVAAGAVVAIYRRRWSWLVPYALVLVALAVWRSPVMIEGGVVWLLGLLASAIAERDLVRGRWSLAAVSLAAAAAFLASRLVAVPDILLGLALAAFISHSAWRTWSAGAALGRSLAGFSYTLYATHFPLAILFLQLSRVNERLAFGARSVALTLMAFIAAAAAARLIALITEDRVAATRAVLLGLRRDGGPAAATASPKRPKLAG